MKKIYLLLLLCCQWMVGIAQLTSIVPNSGTGTPPTTLNVTITGPQCWFNASSPPMQNSDILLRQIATNTVITATNYTLFFGGNPCFGIFSDVIDATFDLNQTHPPGLYNVEVTSYNFDPFTGQNIPVLNILTDGFNLIGGGDQTITGEIYFDINGNSIKDGADYNLPNQVISASNSFGTYSFGNRADGSFTYYAALGSNAITLTSPSPNLSISPSLYNFMVPTTDSTGYDFAVTPTNAVIDAYISMVLPFGRCNFNYTTPITIANTGTLPLNAVYSLSLNNMNNPTFMPMPDSSNAGVYYWNINNLLPLQNYNISVNLTYGPNGQAIYNNCLKILDSNGNQIDYYCEPRTQTILCSFDPNDKLVFPVGLGMDGYTLKEKPLEYTIRFQNTGNDTAFTVTLYDTLDTDLNISTFRLLNASHNVDFTIDAANVLTFTFENILLPDSNVDLNGSNGFVSYYIEANQPILTGTQITNNAGIVFDLNPPVITNTTLTTYVDTLPTTIDPITLNSIKAIPNPASQFIMLKTFIHQNLNVEIIDVTGRVLKQISINQIDTAIDISAMPSGTYLIKATEPKSNQIYTHKFIKI